MTAVGLAAALTVGSITAPPADAVTSEQLLFLEVRPGSAWAAEQVLTHHTWHHACPVMTPTTPIAQSRAGRSQQSREIAALHFHGRARLEQGLHSQAFLCYTAGMARCG